MAPAPEKQAGKLLQLLAQEGKEYGDLVAERLVELVQSEPFDSRDELHRQLVIGAAPYLSHTAWYARVAAASCLERLARLEYGRGLSSVTEASSSGDMDGTDVKLTDKLAKGWVGLQDVRLDDVLARGALLLSNAESADYTDSEGTALSADIDLRVGRQRKRLLRCLGLAGGSGEQRAVSLYSSFGDMIDDEDIEGPTKPASTNLDRSSSATSSYFAAKRLTGTEASAPTPAPSQLSARQRNRLAREARSKAAPSLLRSKRRRRSENAGGSGDESERDEGPPAFLGRSGGMIDLSSGARGALVSLAADLVAQLFHPLWQCRHGAALGALSILRAWNARRRKEESVPYGNRMRAWAEDAAARCVCVLALDRFGDYSSRMVAPVRETAGQLLAVAALQLDSSGLRKTAELLSELTTAEQWQPRHGGFCGLDSLCAVAIGGETTGRERAPREISSFLRSLVGRIGPRGLADPVEDVCAAAARAVGLVMRRFLPTESRESGGGGGEDRDVARLRGFARQPERGGENVFDLVWKALDRLNQYSSCVEDLAGLLEICCEDVGPGPGSADCLLGGNKRQRILVDLWGDGRARVRACAVRSLLALARGMVGATLGTKSLQPAQAVTATAAVTTGERCDWLLRRCFSVLLSEADEDVRGHCGRLWSVLVKDFMCTDDPAAASAALATACLRVLFAPPTTLDSSTAHTSPGSAAAADTRPASNAARSKRARRTGSLAVTDPEQQAKQGEILAEEWAGKGAAAPFLARLMAVEALSELIRAVDYHGSTSAAQLGAPTRAHGADGVVWRSKTAKATPRELILKEAARKAGSPWAWERELAFFIVEACAGREGRERAVNRSLPPSNPSSEESEAIQVAWAAVDGALRATAAGDINSGKVFRELEGVDAAVSTACSGVIRVLLSQAAPATSDGVSPQETPAVRGTAAAVAADDGKPGPSRAPPSRGKRKRSKPGKTGSKATANAVAASADAACSGASRLPSSRTASRAAKGKIVKVEVKTEVKSAEEPLLCASSVEKTFQSLAVAFGETLKPLKSGATRQQTEVVWTGRMRHFHARIQAQQALLARRITAAAASAYTVGWPLPSELNPILRPLVAAVKKEEDPERRRRSASRLARVAAELLEDANPERRDAGGMVVFGLAATAGGHHFVTASTSLGEGEALPSVNAAASAAAHAGATETLRYTVTLGPPPIAPPSPVGSLVGISAMTFDNDDGSGSVDRGGSGGREANGEGGVRGWVLQTLVPLARYAADSASEKFSGKLSLVIVPGEAGALLPVDLTAVATAAPVAPQLRKLSAGERKMSAAELHTHELSAALGVVESLVRATRDPVDGRAGPLAALMLETPLVAGLLALARSIPTPEDVDDSEVSAHASYNGSAAVGAALAIAKDAASICPKGLWLGLRAELLPAMAGSSARGYGVGRGGGEVRSARERSRASLVLKEIVEGMGTGVVPFATRLLPVALKGMTDADEEVRGNLAATFNRLVKAVALAADGEDGDAGVASGWAIRPPAGEEATVVERDGELIARHLVRGEPLPRLNRDLLPKDLTRSVATGVTLRPYQWEGVAWIDFLRRIGAHGVLADDMGLGKTLQSLMAVAMCHHEHPGRRSLVVCPSILVRHWQAECSKYFSDDVLRPVAYAGRASTRRRLAERLGLIVNCARRAPPPTSAAEEGRGQSGKRSYREPISRPPTRAAAAETTREEAEPGAATAVSEEGEEHGTGVAVEKANVVVTSYNVLGKDADVLSGQAWLFLILDEAHVLRNPATRTAKAARSLRSNHRLGLTGTPIQNSVLELWSLFQFLMPGYLGDRRSFQRDVARPVREALSADGDGRATVKGLKELEKLHRQVLPFVLRREKIEVLADLPPKIVTDMMCDLTPEQRRLHQMWERGGDGGVLQAVAVAEASEAARVRAMQTTARSDDASKRDISTPSTPSGADASSGAGGAASTEMEAMAAAAAAAAAATGTTVVANRERISIGAQALVCLSKLQLLCVHPALAAKGQEDAQEGARKDVRLSGKLMALRELLWDAGIGERKGRDEMAPDDGDISRCSDTGDSSDSNSSTSSEADDVDRDVKDEEDADGSSVKGNRGLSSTSRASEVRMSSQRKGYSCNRSNSPLGGSKLPGCKCLVFAQHKAALDVTESALLRPWFRGVKYLRMDGSLSQAHRAEVVDRFSTDASVAVLLLTTRVGHLGLNLSAASMVVFLEHDWNPQVDLQAMDRAHRLGQQKTVNVYRLIAANSVEQRVLRLQGHKLGVASAVVSKENSSAFARGTGGILNILGTAADAIAAGNKKSPGEGQDGARATIDEEGFELWCAEEDYAYLAAEHLADSVARD